MSSINAILKLANRFEKLYKFGAPSNQGQSSVNGGTPDWVNRFNKGESFWIEGDTAFAVGAVKNISSPSLANRTATTKAQEAMDKGLAANASKYTRTKEWPLTIPFTDRAENCTYSLMRIRVQALK